MSDPRTTSGDEHDEQPAGQDVSPIESTPPDAADAPAEQAGPPDSEAGADPSAAHTDEAASEPRVTDAYDEDSAAVERGGTSFGRSRLLTIIVSVVLVLVLVGTSVGVFFSQRGNRAADNDQVIAEVGDQNITRGEFLRNYTPGNDAEATLDQIIDFKLVVQAASEEGVTADQAEIDEQIEQLRSQHNDPENFNQFLQEVNIESEEQLRQLLGELQIFNTMLLNHTVVEQANVRHILLQADTEEAVAERQSEAEALLDEIEGGADFAELAREHSEDPGSGQQGGDLGWVPQGVFVPEFEEAIFSMEPGEVRLVQSQFGWHIIELKEPREERPIENPDFMRSPEVQVVFTGWIDDLRAEAEQNNEIDILVDVPDLAPPAPTLAPLPTTQPQ